MVEIKHLGTEQRNDKTKDLDLFSTMQILEVMNEEEKGVQLQLDFSEQKKEEKNPLEDIDPLNITPIEALNILYDLKEKYNKNKE